MLVSHWYWETRLVASLGFLGHFKPRHIRGPRNVLERDSMI